MICLAWRCPREKCHTASPHQKSKRFADVLNSHTERLACETCHITKLGANNMVFADWLKPEWNEEEGIYEPHLVRSGDLRKAVQYLWFNGNGTFLANALGAHPDGGDSYNPLMKQYTRYDKMPEYQLPGLRNNDFLSVLSPELRKAREEMVTDKLFPIMKSGKSRIYPFKIFNARMIEDMNNEGPFGAMILPFDYPTYYETGDPMNSVKKAISHPMVKRMYELPFKLYMMDEFMAYFGVGSWKTDYPLDASYPGKLEGQWMRQFTAKGSLMDFDSLGYSADRKKDLQEISEKAFR